MSKPFTLHGYWRSSAAYRVRIALALKGIDYAQIPHDLRHNAHLSETYRAIAPHGLVPALDIGGAVLIESPAILEWLEERFPAPALLPAGPEDRAIVRAMAAIVGCDIHPVNNLRILRALKHEFGAPQSKIDAWAVHWIVEGFTALETLVARHGEGFCFGAAPTLADCYLAPQIYNARRFGVDLTPFPALAAADANCAALEPFQAAHPSRQPDAGED